MLCKQTLLGLTIAGLLLGVLLSGCGDSGETPKSVKKPANFSKNHAAPLKKEQAFSPPQPLETIKEGRNLLNKEKLAGNFKEDRPLAASPEGVFRRRSSAKRERKAAPPYIAPHVEMPQ